MLEYFLQHVWGISIGGVFILSVLYVWFCAGKIYALNAEVKNILQTGSVDAALKDSELLAPVWRNFEKSLTKTKEQTYSTVDAAEFFSPQNLTRGMNMTFWQSYGGIFTGLGILGTFVGLTYGLSKVDVTSEDIEVLKNGVKNLLSSVELAFITSLFGIGSALLYSWIHHSLLVKFQRNVQKLADTLDEKFPRRSAEDWLAENITEAKRRIVELQSIDVESQNQTAALQNIGGQIANGNSWLEKNHAESQSQTAALQSIDAESQNQTTALQNIDIEAKEQTTALKNIGEQVAEAIHNALDEKLAEYVESICAAIEKLGAGGTEVVGEVFSSKVGAQMDRFSAALDKFSDSIDEKLKAANKISEIMNEQMLNTLTELGKISVIIETEQENSAGKFEALVNKLIEDLGKFMDSQKRILDNSASSNAAQISEAVKAFREIVNNHNATIQKTFSQIQKFLNDSQDFLQSVDNAGTSLELAADPIYKSSVQLSNHLDETTRAAEKFRNEITAQITNLGNVNQTTRQNISDLSIRLAEFVRNFNGIAKELETSTNTIKNSLEHYNYEMSDGLKNALTKFDKSMSDSVGHLKSILEELSDALEDLKQIRNRR